MMFAVLVLLAGCSTPEAGPLPNVRLGMTPRDVRERFEPGGPGAWQTNLGSGDDTALEWKALGPAKIAQARFEFHIGMLVAMRARTTEPRTSESISTTPKTVTLKQPAAEGGTSIMVLARDCPTHKDEAEALAARAKR